MVKIKDKNNHLAIAIKENYSAGMKAKDIANLFGISNRWRIIANKIDKKGN